MGWGQEEAEKISHVLDGALSEQLATRKALEAPTLDLGQSLLGRLYSTPQFLDQYLREQFGSGQIAGPIQRGTCLQTFHNDAASDQLPEQLGPPLDRQLDLHLGPTTLRGSGNDPQSVGACLQSRRKVETEVVYH